MFTAKQFIDLVPKVPKKGFIVWDEPGVGMGHRRWASPENIALGEIFHAFRFMMVNVFFAVPRRGLIDRTARNLLHLELRLRRRGQATVYRIFPSDWSREGIVTIRKGWVDLGKPTKELTDAYEEMKHRHGIGLLEKTQLRRDIRELG